MRRVLISLIIAVALVGLGALTNEASAGVVIQRTDAIGIDLNTCGGEEVRVVGSSLLIVRTFGDDGLAVRNIITLTGTGLTSGTEYVVNVQSAFTVSDNDTIFESTFRSTMVSKGPAPDQVIVGRISSDPDVPSTITTECRG